MGRLFGILGSLFVYLCVGTVVALALILAYAATHGYLDRDKLARMADVARGIEIAQVPVEQLKNYTALKDRLLQRPAVRKVLEREQSVLLQS